jgi:hypothetical protein
MEVYLKDYDKKLEEIEVNIFISYRNYFKSTRNLLEIEEKRKTGE